MELSPGICGKDEKDRTQGDLQEVERAVIENIPDLSSTSCENNLQLHKSGSDPSQPVTSSSSSRITASAAPAAYGKRRSAWNCNICHEIFPDRPKLFVHSAEFHRKQFPNECQRCHHRFVTDNELVIHFRQNHLALKPQVVNKSGTNTNGEVLDNNSNSIVLTNHNHNTSKPRPKPKPKSKCVNVNPGEPRVEPIRIQTNSLKNFTPVAATATDSRNKKPLKTYSRLQKRSPSSIDVPISEPQPQPEVRCYRCRRNYSDIEKWTYHVVNFHIKDKNPYPIVAMNYVDPETLREPFSNRKSTSQAEILTPTTAAAAVAAIPLPIATAASSTGQIKSPNEDLKITVRRKSSEKRSYQIVKKPSRENGESPPVKTANDSVIAPSSSTLIVSDLVLSAIPGPSSSNSNRASAAISQIDDTRTLEKPQLKRNHETNDSGDASKRARIAKHKQCTDCETHSPVTPKSPNKLLRKQLEKSDPPVPAAAAAAEKEGESPCKESSPNPNICEESAERSKEASVEKSSGENSEIPVNTETNLVAQSLASDSDSAATLENNSDPEPAQQQQPVEPAPKESHTAVVTEEVVNNTSSSSLPLRNNQEIIENTTATADKSPESAPISRIEVSTIRKAPAKERSPTPSRVPSPSSEILAANGEPSRPATKARTGADDSLTRNVHIKQIISSNAHPLRRPITIGSMSIIPTDYIPEEDNHNSSLTEEPEEITPNLSAEDSEKEEEQPESILPLSDDDLERSTIPQDAQKLKAGDAQTSVTTITSEPKDANSGMLSRKKQFITTMMIENENRDRQCNGDGTPIATEAGAGDSNNNQSINTSPANTRPSSKEIAPPQFENITPPNSNSEETDHDEEGENLVIHIRPEDIQPAEDDRPEPDNEDNTGPENGSGSSEQRNGDNERLQNGPNEQNESDDFKCRMCDKIFTSDNELHSHFNEVHLRIGRNLSSSIFEPESPYPVQQQDAHDLISANTAALQEVRQAMEMELMERQRALAENQRRRHSAEILSLSLTRSNHVSENALGALQVRASGTAQPGIFQPQMMGPTSQSILPRGGVYASGLPRQPAVSQPRPQVTPRYSMPSNQNPRMSAHTHSAMQQQQQQLQTGRHPLFSGPAFPSQQIQHNIMSLHQQRFSQTQMQNQRMLLQQQQQQQQQSNRNLQRSLSTESENVVRAGHVVRNGSFDDGPRIVDTASIARNILINDTHQHQLSRHMTPPNTQLDRRMIGHPNVPLNMSRVNENQNQMQNLIQAKRIVSLEAERAAKRQRLDHNGYGGIQNHMNQLQGQGMSQKHAYQQAMAAMNQNVPTFQQRPSPPEPDDRNNANIASLRLGNAITLSVCPTTESSPSNMSNRPDNSFAQSAMSFSSGQMSTDSVASALAIRGVTVTPAGAEQQLTTPRRSPINISITANPTTTDLRHSPVTPPRLIHSPATAPPSALRMQMQSPPLQQHSPGHQFAIPRGPAPRMMYTTATVNSAIERPDRPPTVDLTEEEINQQAREIIASRQPNQNQQMQQQMQQQQMLAGRQISPSAAGNPPTAHRNPVARPAPVAATCGQCGVLFNSIQALEEHKIARHSVPGVHQHQQQQHQRSEPVPVSASAGTLQRMINPTQNTTIRPPAAQQGNPGMQSFARPQISPPQPQMQSRPNVSAQNSTTPRYLYIPLIDINRLDPGKLRKLEELGILSVMPLHGNESTGGQMGIPVLSLRPEVNNQHLPWDSVLPVGPVHQIGTQPHSNSNVPGSQQNSRHQTIHHR